VTEKVQPEEYSLEIYEPGSRKSCLVAFKASTPFMAINVGDFIRSEIYEGEDFREMLRVDRVEHIVWNIMGPRHKVMGFTTAVAAN
jgi:hypothetical protein